MAEEPRTPVAIRISRPFGSEDELLQHELDTLTRTTVVLLGAQSRPQGVVLRFEIALASGDTLLRGEGRVVGFRPAAQGVDSGLTLRFTRLDARSKALVDRAANMREARARASLHPRAPAEAHLPPPPPMPPSAPLPDIRTDPALEDTPSSPTLNTEVNASPSAPSSPELSPAPSPAPSAARSAARPPAPSAARQKVAPPPPSSGAIPASVSAPRREELLDRLRQRAKTLSPSAVESLLASRRRA